MTMSGRERDGFAEKYVQTPSLCARVRIWMIMFAVENNNIVIAIIAMHNLIHR
jgi:hypothetical protein